MADKPSNSRKRVNYQPARNGQAARWQIEDRQSTKKPSPKKADAPQEPRSQKECAQARAAERRKEQANRPLPDKTGTDAKEHAKPRREEHQVRIAGRRPASTASRTPASRIRKQAPAQARTKTRVKVPANKAKAPAAEHAEERVRPERVEHPKQPKQTSRPERVIADNPQRMRHATSDRTRGQVMEAMLPQASSSGTHSTIFGLSMRTILIAALLVVVVVFFLWHPWSRGTDAVTAGEEATPPPSDILEERLATVPSYGTVAPVDFNAVEEEGFTAGFVLAHGGVVTDYSIYDTEPELSDESAQALNQALEPFAKNDIITAFLLMDIQTGRGFARNIDKTLYGASSFKGPYCAYLLKQYVDNGDTEITDSFASGYMTASLGYARSGSDSLKNLIKDTIVDSSNDAFASLRVNFSDNTLAKWLTSVDVDERVAYDTWFPFNTVRNMAKLWMETYYFLQTNSEAANTLRGYMGETTKSFMREALTGVRVLDEDELTEEAGADDADDANGEEATEDVDEASAAQELLENSKLQATGSLGQNVGASIEHAIDVLQAPEITVIDKAGWNIDADENYDALVDCGIVTCNGRDYLLCVMCDAAYTPSNVDKFEQLIAAIFEARRDLA